MHRPTIGSSSHIALLTPLVALLVGIGGCQREYRKFAEQITTDVAAGQYEKAATDTDAKATEEADEKVDRLVYMLEAGRSAQLNGDEIASDRWFDSASEIVRPYLAELAEAKVSEAAATTAVNQTVAEYRGTHPERTMLETMVAMNAMVRGDAETARIALNRANAWQQNAVEANRREIEEAEAAAAEEKAEAEEKKIDFGAGSTAVLGNENFANLRDMTAYADYSDPFATYLRGLFLLTAGDSTDLDNAYACFRRVAALNGEDSHAASQVAGDLELLEMKRGAGTLPPHTWIVLLEGMVPYREEFRLDIPIPVGDVNYVSGAFPYLKDREANAITGPEIEWNGARYPFMEISDVGRMVKADFGGRLPTIVTQEVLSSALKAMATYVAKQAGGTWAQIGGMAYQAASTAADLRSWRTMPNRILVARVETPVDGVIKVFDSNGTLSQATVPAGSSGVVFVDKPSVGAVASVRSGVLLPAPGAPPTEVVTDRAADSPGAGEAAAAPAITSDPPATTP